MNTPTYGNYDPLHVSVQPPMEHAVATTSQAYALHWQPKLFCLNM